MHEIRTILRGGLGNQLFQIAASIYFARKLHAQLVLDDSAIYKHQDSSRRSWSRQIDLSELFDCGKIRWEGKSSRFLRKIIPNHKIEQEAANLVGESYLLGIKELDRNVIVSDWFVNKRYPIDTLPRSNFKIMSTKEFFLSLPTRRSHLQASAAIHIRLGDFKSTAWGTLSEAWYQEGVERLLDLGVSEIDCYSDEIPEAKRMLSPYFKSVKIKFPEEKRRLNPISLLSVLSDYEYFVSSNSTLSWWGSYLNAGAKAIFCAWEDDLMIKDWQKLKI